MENQQLLKQCIHAFAEETDEGTEFIPAIWRIILQFMLDYQHQHKIHFMSKLALKNQLLSLGWHNCFVKLKKHHYYYAPYWLLIKYCHDEFESVLSVVHRLREYGDFNEDAAHIPLMFMGKEKKYLPVHPSVGRGIEYVGDDLNFVFADTYILRVKFPSATAFYLHEYYEREWFDGGGVPWDSSLMQFVSKNGRVVERRMQNGDLMTQASFQHWSGEYLKEIVRELIVHAAFDTLLKSLTFDERQEMYERCLSIQGPKGFVTIAKVVRKIREEGAVPKLQQSL
jgi:hypothetical protein